MSYLSSPRAKLCMQFKRRVGFLQLQVGRIFLSAFACSSFPAFNLCPYISLPLALSVPLMTALCIHIPGLSFYPGTCQEKKWDTPAWKRVRYAKVSLQLWRPTPDWEENSSPKETRKWFKNGSCSYVRDHHYGTKEWLMNAFQWRGLGRLRNIKELRYPESFRGS